jgi:hypothetical protein
VGLDSPLYSLGFDDVACIVHKMHVQFIPQGLPKIEMSQWFKNQGLIVAFLKKNSCTHNMVKE